MKHIQISKDLALAIGYRAEHVRVHPNGVMVYRPMTETMLMAPNAYEFGWYTFDHRSPNVVLALGEWKGHFPRLRDGKWVYWMTNTDCVMADTVADAIALGILSMQCRKF